MAQCHPAFRSLTRQRAWEQHIIFQVDVLHQVINQFINAVIHRFQAASGGGVTLLVVLGLLPAVFTCFIVLASMLIGHCLAAHALFDHRKRISLFFHHVAGKLFMQHSQVFCQPFGTLGLSRRERSPTLVACRISSGSCFCGDDRGSAR